MTLSILAGMINRITEIHQRLSIINSDDEIAYKYREEAKELENEEFALEQKFNSFLRSITYDGHLP